MAAAAISVFEKLEILTISPCMGPICAKMPNFMKIDQTVAEIWRFDGFFKMADGRHLGFVGYVLGPPTKTTPWSVSLS